MAAGKIASLLAYIYYQLCTTISTNDCDLYREDGLMIQEYINDQQLDQLHKKIINFFKEIDLKIEIKTDLKIVDFLGMKFNLINVSYKAYKNPNDTF